MSNTNTPVSRTTLRKVLRILYIVLFAVSLVVVVSYIALKIFAPAPEVPDQVVISLDGWDGTEEPGSAENSSNRVVLNRKKGVYTCLLLGVADQGGSDTIMLGVFDTKENTASLISVPRDTVVRYNGSYVKINAAYSYGGVEAVAASVSKMLAVPIDYYVSVNTRAFREIVDEIGGIDFNVPVDMNYNDPYGDISINITAGYHHLNGRQAEGVVRCRNCYPDADIGRSATQRAFLIALAKQTITLSNASKVTNLINILNTYVDSDMPLNDMVYFGTQAVGMDLDTAMTTGGLPGVWKSPYWVLDDSATLTLVNNLGIYEDEVPAKAIGIVHP